jgi:DNA polymerase III alpha subunit
MQGFKDGLLVGIFQFSATAAKLTRQVKPDTIFELAAINALIRPGPAALGSDQPWLRDASTARSRSPTGTRGRPRAHLGYTFGELVFQEQLIEVVHHLGGL